MAVMLRDCLTLPSFRSSVVISGRDNLNNVVRYCTVLEGTRGDDLQYDVLREHELAITSFIAIKDNVEEQCKCIELLHKSNAAGLVLLKSPTFLPSLDDVVIRFAREKSFPIIFLDSENFRILFHDIIHDIVNLIHQDEINSQKEYIEHLSEVSSEAGITNTVRELLNWAGKGFNCWFVLTDKRMRPVLKSEIPEDLSEVWTDQDPWTMIDTSVQKNNLFSNFFMFQQQSLTLQLDQISLQVCTDPILDHKGRRFCMWRIGHLRTIPNIVFDRLQEIVVRFLDGIQDLSGDQQAADDLIESLCVPLTDKQNEYAAVLQINPDEIRSFVILSDSIIVNSITDGSEHADENALLAGHFLGYSLYFYRSEELPSFWDNADRIKKPVGWSGRFERIRCLEEISQLMNHYCRLYKLFESVFPYRRFLDKEDLYLLNCINNLSSKTDKQIRTCLYEPLLTLKGHPKLLSLCQTLILDAKMNTRLAAELLFMHPNTVYYQMKKVKSILGFDPFSVSGAGTITFALGLLRMDNNEF